MSNWLVTLKGERFDLEDLPELLRSPEIRVVEENGLFYLRSTEFDSLNSADEVRERAIAIIRLINGAAKIYRDDFLDVLEGGVIQFTEDGKLNHHVLIAETTKARSKMNARVYSANGSERKANLPSNLEWLLDIAQKHRNIADALNFYREDTWINLYKIYEIIRDDTGGKNKIVSNHWVTNDEISRFTQTAQSRAALGDSARHASEKNKPPSQPMTHTEARSLIKNIILKWSSSKK